MSALRASIIALLGAAAHGVILDEDSDFELTADHLSDATEAIKKLDIIYEGHASDAFFFRMHGHDDREKAIAEVKAKTGTDAAGVYGELSPKAAAHMLDAIGAQPGQKFYDLGAGHGKVVVLAHLLGLDSTGVELASDRWNNSCEAVKRMQKQDAGLLEGDDKDTGMRFLKNSFLEVDFSDADLVFTDSVEFTPAMLEGIAKTAQRMRPGTKIVTWQGLPGDHFKKLPDLELPSSWNKNEKFTVQEIIGTGHEASLAETHEFGSQAKAGDTVCVL